MDFVNRLKPEHLQSFWYFSSKVNFALIGTFGSLLWATAPSIQEAEFYKARLSEYRWTLRVSSRGADFMEFAVGVLDASAGYLQQEQLKKRGPLFVGTYQSTVGNGENLGLGMGVGNSNIDLSQPPPQPPPGWSAVPTTRAQLSPVPTNEGHSQSDDDEMEEGESDDSGENGEEEEEEEEYDEMMEEEGYSDEACDSALPRPPLPASAQARYAAVSAAVNARRGQSVSAGFAAYQQQTTNTTTTTTTVSAASTPTSSSTTTSSNAAMDFFMIPNTGFGSSGE